jgi:putative ABC transport system permease protein
MNRSQIFRWLLFGEWRAHLLQAIVAIIAIALGVALGYSIHLINTAAYNEFSAATKSLTGQSDLHVRGTQAMFDENLYPTLMARDGVALANPVLELDVVVLEKQAERSDNKLKVLGIDLFRAIEISPDLIGIPAEGKPLDGLSDDAIFLSPAAMEWLQVKQDESLQLRAGTQTINLRVAGGLVRARAGQRIAVMDIGTVQWRFQHLGLLSRIELKLAEGINHNAFKTKLAQELGEFYQVIESADQETRVNNMSRAYRVNLNMLALVALFTGAFLVFSTRALSVIRRRHQFALLRVLGLTRWQLMRQILSESAVLGVVGSLLGLIIGYITASFALQLFGGDLGTGFFAGIKPVLVFSLPTATVFFLLGLGVTLLGSAVPAWEAANAKTAPALKSGSEEMALKKLAKPWPALLCLGLAGLFVLLPPLFGLPVFGYLAIALLLIGGIALMPYFSTLFFSAALTAISKRISNVIPALTLARLANASNQASIALGGVLASFSLMVAMAIMVTSFRESVDDWLGQVLPADIYVRLAASGDQGGFQLPQQKAIAAIPGVGRQDFSRFFELTLDPGRPNITIIARPIDMTDPRNTLPIIGETVAPALLSDDVVPIWVSEAMVDLYDYTVGKQVSLPLGAAGNDAQSFIVAGVWRDYGRQFGAIQMQLSDYQSLTGDLNINTAALWLQTGITAEQIKTTLNNLSFGDALEITQSSEIRALSLEIFDRSFAVTYLLEAVAVVIGLLGVAASFSAQTLARAKEFGMLRHIGMMRRQIFQILAAEGGLLTVLGVVLGFVIGWSISLILVFIVNPQSFHWTMQLHLPWGWLVIVALVMVTFAALTALIAGRHAVSGNVIRTVREDW